MPYRNKADRKKQVNKPVDSPEFRRRMERQKLDVKWTRQVKTRTRMAKQTSEKARTLAITNHWHRGGSNKDGVKVESASKQP